MTVPAAPPQTMELAASPKIARKPSPEGAADAGLPGTTRLSACMARPAALDPLHCHPTALVLNMNLIGAEPTVLPILTLSAELFR